jgi:hypothetical protein
MYKELNLTLIFFPSSNKAQVAFQPHWYNFKPNTKEGGKSFKPLPLTFFFNL